MSTRRAPNVILLMTDQHRADVLGFMGHPIVRTPHLDGLAARGTVFENAFTQCPVCMASRAAILTGRYPRTIGVPSMGLLPPTEVTLAETLRRAGYRTGVFGKLHLTPQQYTREVLGLDRPVIDAGRFLEPAGIDTPWMRAALEDPHKRNYGFDEAAGAEDFLWGEYLDWLAAASPEHLPYALGESWGCRNLGAKYGVEPRGDRVFTEFAKDFLESRIPIELHPSSFIVERTLDFARRNRDRPFFAHCSFVDPHHPLKAPLPFNRMYPAPDMPIPPALDLARCYPPGLPPGVQAQIDDNGRYPPGLWQWVIATYLGMVSAVDACVGRLLAGLREIGALDNTLVVFVADHGDHAGSHRLLRKGALLFDSLMRIPLCVSWPAGLPGGRRVDDLVQEIDIYPTVMSLLGLPVHGGVQGRSLAPLLGGGSAGPVAGCDSVFCELDTLANPIFANPVYQSAMAIRTRSRKLIYFPRARTGMLYDLDDDPGETVNRYADPAATADRHDLVMEMLDQLHVQKDPLPRRLSQA
jgi:arylsulfatase